MKPHTKILLELKMLDVGVIPNTDHFSNVTHQLDSMDPIEARRAKRKWRKLKRQALRKEFSENRRLLRPSEKFAVMKMLAQDHNT